jgi:hypothetical protein
MHGSISIRRNHAFEVSRDVVVPAALLLATPLHATTALELSLGDLVEGSDVIAIGRVTNVASRWVDMRTLVTEATVDVSEVLKGSASGSILVTLPGGVDTARNIAVTWPAAPTMNPGENVFVFLDREASFGLTVSGFSQGKYSIVNDGTDEVVSRDLRDLKLATGTGAVRGGTADKVLLKDFKRQVREALAGN